VISCHFNQFEENLQNLENKVKIFSLGPLVTQNTQLDSWIAFEIGIPYLDKVIDSQLFCISVHITAGYSNILMQVKWAQK
jgi:hypothetical protein